MIKTKIARILSPTRVVLAAGAEHGVLEGMEFIIYELTDPITDPDTGESLGQLELHKGRVRVIHIQEKIATAMTLLRRVYRPSISELLHISNLVQMTKNPFFLGEGGWAEEHEQLPVDSSVATAVKPVLIVRVGDLARSITEVPVGESHSNGPHT